MRVYVPVGYHAIGARPPSRQPRLTAGRAAAVSRSPEVALTARLTLSAGSPPSSGAEPGRPPLLQPTGRSAMDPTAFYGM